MPKPKKLRHEAARPPLKKGQPGWECVSETYLVVRHGGRRDDGADF